MVDSGALVGVAIWRDSPLYLLITHIFEAANGAMTEGGIMCSWVGNDP